MYTQNIDTYRKSTYFVIKRCFDIIISSVGLLLLWPFMLIIAVCVKIDSEGPAFYTHERIGYHHQKCNIYKFRTMYNNADELKNTFSAEQLDEWNENYKLTDDPRITKLGQFLRKTAIDELPQLINILKGDLSLVGPRPIVLEELKKYGTADELLLSVYPGLTGYWQVYAPDVCPYEERIKMELYYVQNANLWLDFKIILKTLLAFLQGKWRK